MKCLECHVEIKRRVEANTGYHSRNYKSSVGERDCARCHAEHRGPKFALTPLDRNSFDHRAQTGFTLEGKHREQKCESCHTAAKIATAARSEIKFKDLNQSFLGLRRECTNCHQEPHQNQLGADCLGCHNQEAWKPAPGFNHSRASFALTGLHQKVACEKCHARPNAARAGEADDVRVPSKPSQKVVLFKGVPFNNGCPSCHNDPHHGAFQDVKLSGKCDGCHNTGGWKKDRPNRDFSHNLTKFHLVGKHAEVTCGKCHKENDFRRPVAHELCKDCHEDPHKGQFASRAAGSDCSACHSPTNYKPPLFDLDAHMRSPFPLAGKHASLRCAQCHQPEGREARYKTGKLACPACHDEPHGGEFASEPYNNKCDQCHTEKGFEATTFTIERHAQTQFPLTGKHTEVECGKCHKPLAPALSKAASGIVKISYITPTPAADGKSAELEARRQYHFASHNCNACHNDPHELNPEAKLACETCHVPQQWKALRPFDHSSTRFKLNGSHLDASHQPIACIKCHKPSEQADSVAAGTAPLFSKTANQCSGCHTEKNAHGGQFSSPGSLQKDCSSCHTPAAWNGADFDHDQTPFALNVVHRKVECAKCHKEQKEMNGKMLRVYRDTPTDCLKCH